MTVHNFSTQYNIEQFDNLRSYLQTTTMAHMLLSEEKETSWAEIEAKFHTVWPDEIKGGTGKIAEWINHVPNLCCTAWEVTGPVTNINI